MTRSLESFEDESAVRHVIIRYAHTMDNRQFDEFAELYHPDAVLTLDGKPFSGREAIVGWMKELAGSPAGVHMTGNTIVKLEGVRAHAISDFMYGRKLPEGWKLFAAGRYMDTLEKRNGQWLFLRREITLG